MEQVPVHFLCPISLHIMKDPVTTTTGITYDRHSIHQWLTTSPNPVCPITKRPLPRHSQYLTPNHTLRRLIHAWCTCHGVHLHRVPAPLSQTQIIKILRGLNLHSTSLDHLLVLATSEDHVVDRKLLAECGALNATLSFVVRCYKTTTTTANLEKALKILSSMWVSTPTSEIKILVENNDQIIDSLTWVIINYENVQIQNIASLLIKDILKVASSSLVDRIKPELFKAMIGMIRQRSLGPTKAALQIMLEACQHGRNKYRMIEVNAVFELIELELDLGVSRPEYKKVSELIFCILAQLCSSADGRAQLLAHSGGIATVANRIMRVSGVVDDRAVHILGQISKNTGTNEAVQEMERVGAVSKLCMVLQSDCAKYLKEKVREILNRHNYAWRNSPCFHTYLFSL